MTEIKTEYQGHLPDSAIQRPSAGEFFPMALFQRGLDSSAIYYIQYKGAEYAVTDSLQGQSAIARRVAALPKEDWVAALNQAQDAYLLERTSL